MKFDLYNDDCLEALKDIEDNSIDACVTDPPYGINFMQRSWDYDVPKVEIWKEVFRVLKPGAHLLSFFGTRTYHRGVINIEDAGFEIRDMIEWIYGQGFPKSYNIGQSIQKLKTTGKSRRPDRNLGKLTRNRFSGSEEGTLISNTGGKVEIIDLDAKKFEGVGTALKPAQEPIVLARKPLEESTVAKNVLKYGTGGLNIDESRIKSNESSRKFKGRGFASQNQTNKEQGFRPKNYYENQDGFEYESHSKGRFPSNVIHDGSPEVLELLPESNSTRINNINNPKSRKNNQPTSYDLGKNNEETIDHRDSGSSARFFYCAKASVSDREEGLEKLLEKLQAASEFRPNHMEKTLNGESGNPYGRFKKRKNNHPTVKPTALMRYLCKLITPKDGTVLDPFMGSGSTGKACGLEDFNFIGIELDSDYFEIAKLRIEHAYNKEEINNLEKYFN